MEQKLCVEFRQDLGQVFIRIILQSYKQCMAEDQEA